LDQIFVTKLIELRLVYDGTHIKAHANRQKFVNQEVAVEALIYTFVADAGYKTLAMRKNFFENETSFMTMSIMVISVQMVNMGINNIEPPRQIVPLTHF
jgi:hypothetical protein